MNNRKPEILAPAGGKEQLIAAVRCGADAVYLGTKSFNARSSADNFDFDALKEAVCYCHARDVKVYVTMNTLITDSEIAEAKSTIAGIAASGADAVIVQDLGVAALWKKHCPEMKLNASTQMTIHNISSAKAAEEFGFKRVVLARELTLDEIRAIAESVNIEVEVFIHGALCMSVSGTCLLSSMIGGRSGNRGRCAQPCRLPFNCNNRENALSLKDLSLMSKLDDLADAGVASFKIEGRMKRPEYVAAAVTAAKAALEGKDYDLSSLQSVFSRSGFTSGYLDGIRNLDMFGFRRHEDVTAAAGVLKKLAILYKDECHKVPVNISFTANSKMSFAEATDGKYTVKTKGDIPDKAIKTPLDDAYAKKCFAKTGGTVFTLNDFKSEISDDIILSASQLNTMRRDMLDKLYEKRNTSQEKTYKESKSSTISASYSSDECEIRLRLNSIKQIFEINENDRIILPMTEILREPEIVKTYKNNLICELPSLVFTTNESSFLSALDKLHSLGVTHVQSDNIGTLYAAKKHGFTVHTGHPMNILNNLALNEYVKLGAADITVSPELMMTSIEKMKSPVKKGIIGYGFLPLMRFRACPAQTADGCRTCKGLTPITDRLNTKFYIMCSGKKYSSLLNSVPLYIGDKNFSNVNFTTLYYTFESKDTCKKIYDIFSSHSSLNAKKTGGLYYRELL